MSSGTSSTSATARPSGRPPRGMASAISASISRSRSASASCSPASVRSLNCRSVSMGPGLTNSTCLHNTRVVSQKRTVTHSNGDTPCIIVTGGVGPDMAQHSETLVSIPVDDVELEGMLENPGGCAGRGRLRSRGGSSRKSPRNNFVAEVIRDRGLGTLLFDLLTEEEDRVREPLRYPAVGGPPRGGHRVAVESRGRSERENRLLRIQHGRRVRAPGSRALGAMSTPSSRAAVASTWRPRCLTRFRHRPCSSSAGTTRKCSNSIAMPSRNSVARRTFTSSRGAGHLFESEGELEEVADVAADWFAENLN